MPGVVAVIREYRVTVMVRVSAEDEAGFREAEADLREEGLHLDTWRAGERRDGVYFAYGAKTTKGSTVRRARKP